MLVEELFSNPPVLWSDEEIENVKSILSQHFAEILKFIQNFS